MGWMQKILGKKVNTPIHLSFLLICHLKMVHNCCTETPYDPTHLRGERYVVLLEAKQLVTSCATARLLETELSPFTGGCHAEETCLQELRAGVAWAPSLFGGSERKTAQHSLLIRENRC